MSAASAQKLQVWPAHRRFSLGACLPQKIGRYEILSALGEGQYGNVWLAVGEVPGRHGQPGKRRTVAVKRLRDDADAESLRLLGQEFALLDQVKHRSIVRVYEYLPNERAVVMEAVQGLPLRGVIDSCNQAREPIPTEAVIEMVCEIADGLYQAYTSPGDNGEPLALVHRDLKPENIMLTPTGEVKILDFGLARVGNAEFTREDPRWIKGTPIYMAPEQARGEELDHRADLFALGLILYELLMGRPAYQAPPGAKDPAQAMYQAIEQGDLTGALHELGNRLPAVGRIITQLLNPRPHLRYQTGQDLLVDLRQLYRDRSSNLKNFCTYFFESIHRLPAQPEPDPGARMMDEKSPRKSIEERLREKEAGQAAAAAPPPPPAQPRAPGIAVVRRSAPAPEPTPPPAPPPAPPPVVAGPPKSTAVPPRIVPRTASAARPAPSPEEDALPSVRGGKKPPAAAARSADEPGMLPMKPLSALQDEGEPAVDPSATAFFAIPAPKSQAPKPSIPDDPPPVAGGGGGAMPGPSTMAGPPPSTMDRPAYNPPGAIGMGSASSPMMTAAGTPFGVNGPAPQGNANRERDVETSRVWVLVVGMFAMMCLLAITAVATIIFLPKAPEKVAEVTPPPEIKPPVEEPPEEEPVVQVQPQPRKIPAGGTTPKPPAEPKPPPAPSDKLTIKFPGSPAPSSLELVCDGGYRNRANVQGGAASFSGVPGGACTLSPKGGIVASNAPVKAGRTYSCEIRGSTMNCN